MQGQTIGKKVIENGRKRNDARTSVDGADWKSLFRRIRMGDRKSTRLNSSHTRPSRMPSSA